MVKKYEEIYYDKRIKNYSSTTFEEETKKYLKDIITKNPYVDPDIYNRTNSEFYYDITKFLNKKYPERFTYEKGYDYIKDNINDLELRTDQFGFSFFGDKARNPKYPYGKLFTLIEKEYYYQLINNKELNIDKEINTIVECLNNTRTIGGCFIWPLTKGERKVSNYNIQRGIGHYIEDRVDLTLLEIKKCYAYINNNQPIDNLIIKNYLGEDKDNIEKWLKSFGSFENYVKKLCFDNFVNKDYEIIDIVKSDIENEKIVIVKEPSDTIALKDLTNKEDLIRVLKNVSELILDRSKDMEKEELNNS